VTRPPRFRPGGWICDRFQWRAAQVTRAEDLRRELIVAGVCDDDPREYGFTGPDGREWVHRPWEGWEAHERRRPYLREA
jgi:hypothetical protein